MENIGESVDAVLDHLLGRNTIKKGKAIKVFTTGIFHAPQQLSNFVRAKCMHRSYEHFA